MKEFLNMLAMLKQDKQKSLATGQHFNKSGQSLGNMTVTILEKVKSQDPFYRKERETYYIRKCNTFNRGLNLSP